MSLQPAADAYAADKASRDSDNATLVEASSADTELDAARPRYDRAEGSMSIIQSVTPCLRMSALDFGPFLPFVHARVFSSSSALASHMHALHCSNHSSVWTVALGTIQAVKQLGDAAPYYDVCCTPA